MGVVKFPVVKLTWAKFTAAKLPRTESAYPQIAPLLLPQKTSYLREAYSNYEIKRTLLVIV